MREIKLHVVRVIANRKYQIELGQESKKNNVELDVDFWSNGEFSEYEREIKKLENKLVKDKNTLSIKQVKEILDQIVVLKPKMDQIVDTASRNILSSQLRVNIAELVVESLESQGFVLDDSTYEGNDERSNYVVKVKNIAGSEVVTIISPVEEEFGKNSVSINSFDETFVDESTLRQRANDIVTILNEAGLQVGAPEHVGNANTEYRDIKTVRNRKMDIKKREARA